MTDKQQEDIARLLLCVFWPMTILVFILFIFTGENKYAVS